MENIDYRTINFDSIILGTLISADCGGIIQCSNTELAFQLVFRSEQNEQFKIIIQVADVKKIFKRLGDNQMILDFKLKPAAIKTIGDSLRESDFLYQISKNLDECKFQLYLNDLSTDEIAFIDVFFSSIDIFDENVSKVVKEPEPEPESEQNHKIKVQKPNLLKHRKKKLLDQDPEDGSQDYHPQKRPRKQSFSKVSEDCEVIDESPKRSSLRVRNRDDINLCEDLSEAEQLQEALKRSLKGVDPAVIESLSHIEEKKSENDLEHDELYDNVDKTIELFTYSTSNGDITVRMEDYLCLSRNEYLSDVIIDFYLQYIYNVKMTPEQREKTLIIGTHFYSLYSTSSEYSGWNDGTNAGLNAKEKRYRRVEGLLRNDVNIFDKDYIVMPLMDHNHWFLAIVCFPKLNGSYTLDGNIKVDENDLKRNPKKVFQPPIKSSCILIFDSVKGNGSRRTVAINHIKNFLEYEWINKYQSKFQFDVKCLNGHSPKVPLQMNNVDCGCFILEFMERFFVTSPVQDLRFPIDLGDWFSSEEVRSSKRRELAEVIKIMMESTNNQVELPKIRFYGDRKRKSSKSIQFINLDESGLENTNNGNLDGTFRVTENGNDDPNENNNNGNNNDENFNNNNDFNCLDSNNTLQNGNVILENQEAVHSIMRDEEIIESKVERVTTQEMMEYEHECYFDDESKVDSVALDTSEEMEVDETQNNESDAALNYHETKIEIISEKEAEICPKTENDTKELETDAKTSENDANVVEEDAKIVNGTIAKENDAKLVENDAAAENDAELDESVAEIVENDAKLDESDAKIQESEPPIKKDAEMANNDTITENDAKDTEIDANGLKCDANGLEKDAKSDTSIPIQDSDVEEIRPSPEKIDLTLDDSFEKDEKDEEPKINNVTKIDEMDVDPTEQNQQEEPEKEQENQKSENMQSIADRISQSITLKESTIVLLD